MGSPQQLCKLPLQLVETRTARQHHPNLCNEDHVFSAELLFQLPHESHLNLLERFQLGHGDKDDDGFPATTNFNFLGERIAFQLEHKLRQIQTLPIDALSASAV